MDLNCSFGNLQLFRLKKIENYSRKCGVSLVVQFFFFLYPILIQAQLLNGSVIGYSSISTREYDFLFLQLSILLSSLRAIHRFQ